MTKQERRELMEQLKETPLEKNDVLAMVLAALISFIPILLLIIGFFVLIIWFFFLR